MRREEGVVAARLALVGLVWGGAYVAGRVVAEAMDPGFASAVRIALSSLCCVPILLAMPPEKRRVARADLPGVVLLGLVGILGFNVLFFLGLARTSAVHGALIGATAPAATALLAALVLGERLRPGQWAGVALSLAGVVAVVSNGSLAALEAFSFNPGDLMLGAAVACWAVYTVAGGGLVRRNGPFTIAAHAYFVAAAIALPAAGVGIAVAGIPTLPASWTVWAALLFLGTVSSVLGFVWWNEGMAVLGPSRTAVFYNLVPVSGVILGGLLLGEAVTAVHLAGGLLVAAGVLLTVRDGR